MCLVRLSFFLTIVSACYSSSSTPKPGQFTALRNCLLNSGINSNNIIRRGTHQYRQLNYQWNQLQSPKTPHGYLIVDTVQDVQVAVACSKKLNIRIVPKGGGHSYENYEFGDKYSIVIDLQRLDDISADRASKTCNVGPGVLFGQLNWKLYSSYSLMVPLGTCPTVGISSSLGGGYGYSSRLYGLISDSLIELEMVDSSGSLLIANNKTNPSLFWALRGAGAGSFGIVTRYKFRAYNLPQNVIFGTSMYDLSMFPFVFDKWQRLFKSNPPKDVNARLEITNGLIILKVLIIQETRANSDRVQKILDIFPKTNDKTSIKMLPFSEYLLTTSHPEFFGITELSQFQNLTRHSYAKQQFKSKSFFVKEVIGQKDIWTIFNLLETIPNKRTIQVEMYAFGGAIDEIASTETAFAHRQGNLYLVQAFFSDTHNEAGLQFSLAWLRKFFHITKLLLKHNASYQNYVDGDMKDFLMRYYGTNLNRLIKVKGLIDPDNYFHFPQSVPLTKQNLLGHI